jgi:hypothetical protein
VRSEKEVVDDGLKFAELLIRFGIGYYPRYPYWNPIRIR